MIRKVAFVGVGTMGAPMARNLLKGGFELRVFDVNAEAAGRLASAGATRAASPAEATRGVDAAITMLPNSEHVETALFGRDGLADALAKGSLYIDMSTIAPTVTDRIAARMAERGVDMVDAPVGRLPQHAAEGKLLVMAGGSAEAVERARPLFEKMGDTIHHCGPVGMGARMKVVNNFMSIALNALTAEALTLAERSGLDPELARKVMLGTAAGQGHMGGSYPSKVLKGDLTPGFMIDLAHKDLGLALDLGKSLGLALEVGGASRSAYDAARAEGRGREDWTAIYAMMRGKTG